MVTVKANQKKLYQQLVKLARTESAWSVNLKSESTRGRKTQRLASVFELPESIQQQWPGAQVGIVVVRWGTRREKPYFEQHYYISSWREQAAALGDRIRAHWGIENPLHWVKDVVLGEDHSSIAAKPAAAVMGMNSFFLMYFRILQVQRFAYQWSTGVQEQCPCAPVRYDSKQ